jgi:hypothetical protein
MAITSLDTHQTVKELTAAGFTDAQAEALTHALRQVQQIDLSDLATKGDIALLRSEMDTKLAELKAEIIRWVFGIGLAQIAAIVALIKLLPGPHP